MGNKSRSKTNSYKTIFHELKTYRQKLNIPRLLLLLAALLAGIHLLAQVRGSIGDIPLSSYQCTGEGKQNTTCILYNVIAHKAKIYYVTLEPVTLPPFAMTWRPEAQFDIPLPLQQVDPDTVAAIGLSRHATIPTSILWYRLDLVDNFYHMVAEHGASIHNLICKHLGLCEYSARALAGFRLVFVDPKPASTWAAVNDNWACFSEEAPVYFGEMGRTGETYLLQKTVVGVGPDCRAFLFCMRDHFGGDLRPRLPPTMMASWRRRICQCVGVDPERSVTTAQRPVIYVMNRAFESRRSFVNFDDAVARVKAAFPHADVRAFYLENRDLMEQAQAFAQASVIFLMHGAQFGNLPFVAKDAVLIEAMPYMPPFDGSNDHSYYQVSLVKELAPVANLTMLEYDSPAAHTTKLRMDALLQDDKYTSLAPA